MYSFMRFPGGYKAKDLSLDMSLLEHLVALTSDVTHKKVSDCC